MGRTSWSGIFSAPPQNTTIPPHNATSNTAATTFVTPRVFSQCFTREVPRLWTAEQPFDPDSESFFRDAVQEALLSTHARHAIDSGTAQSNPAEENLGRVSYSTPAREAESQRLLEQVRNINSIGELRPIFRRVQELEDEERVDRQLARQRRHAAMSAAAAAALAETEASLARSGQTLADLLGPLNQTMNMESTEGHIRPADFAWDNDDSFELSITNDYAADTPMYAMGMVLPLPPVIPTGAEDESSDEQSESDMELPDPRQFLRRRITRPTMGSH